MEIYNLFIKNTPHEKQIIDFINFEGGYSEWVNSLYSLENAIGGIGIHNVNYFKPLAGYPRHISGTYDHEDRDIFRTIQYASVQFTQHFIGLDHRMLVDNSSLHIEGLISRIYQKKVGKKHGIPMGSKIFKLKSTLEMSDRQIQDCLDKSLEINKVYCKAKHIVDYDTEEDPLSLDTHLFSYQEAVIFYFACRILGLELMEWMRENNIPPKSYMNLPEISLEEFNKMIDVSALGLRYWSTNECYDNWFEQSDE